MIKFAIKTLVVMVLAGHAIKLAEPAGPVAAAPEVIPVVHADDESRPDRDVVRDLSLFTNARIVVSHATRDAAGFCEREALACQSGEEIMIRLATGIRDLAAGFLAWAEDEKEIGGSTTEEEEYRPLKNYTGAYPILPEARPVRRDFM